jgi:hypothetical protein
MEADSNDSWLMITSLVTVDDSVYQFVLIKQNKKESKPKKKEIKTKKKS